MYKCINMYAKKLLIDIYFSLYSRSYILYETDNECMTRRTCHCLGATRNLSSQRL